MRYQEHMKAPSLVTFKRPIHSNDHNIYKSYKVASHLEDVFNNSIRGTKQINTRDAAHLRLHSTWRQVLLPQTWNHQRAPRAKGGAITKLDRAQ